MNYNLVTLISLVICVIISFLVSYYLVLLILGENNSFFKLAQFIVAITCLTSFYAPIKYVLIKFMNLEEEKKEDE